MRQEVYAAFTRWLERYTPPRHMQGSDQAMQDEADALMRAIARHTPRAGAVEWIDNVLAHLDETMKTRAWPSVSEVTRAARDIASDMIPAGEARDVTAEDAERKELELYARRIKRGDAIGEHWIYGSGAARLLERAYITNDDLDPYRSGLFFSWKNVYGAEIAREKEQAARNRHDEAVALLPVIRREREEMERTRAGR
jgi:hypothetical protein